MSPTEFYRYLCEHPSQQIMIAQAMRELFRGLDPDDHKARRDAICAWCQCAKRPDLMKIASGVED